MLHRTDTRLTSSLTLPVAEKLSVAVVIPDGRL